MIVCPEPRRILHRVSAVQEPIAGGPNQVRVITAMSEEQPVTVDRVAFVLNPASGGGGGDNTFLAIARELRQHDVHVAAFETYKDGGAAPAVEEALGAGFEEIWVIGGDGTIQQTLEPIVGAEAVLGPIPGGTGNSLVRVIGHTVDDPVAEARWLMHQPPTRIDIGDCNGHLFSVRLGIGFEAAAAEEVEDEKSGLGNLAYIVAGVETAGDFVPTQMRLSAGDESVYEGQAFAAMFTNMPLRALVNIPGLESGDPLSGVLHAIIVREQPKVRSIWRWLTSRPNLGSEDNVFVYSAPAYHVETSDGTPVHADGESLGEMREMDVVCRPRALRIRGLELRGM